MRTISADNEAILQAGARSVAIRMQVKDAGGTFRDLSTYPGVDLFQKVDWSESLDSEGVTWSATISREQRRISVAPMVADSPLNRGFDPAASYAPLLQIGRQMKVEYSLQAYGDPRARSWAIAFAGYIDTVDSASGDNVQLTGRGLEAKIINAFLERERVYAFCQGAYATRGAFIWPDPAKGTAYTTFAVGDLVLPTGMRVNGHFYRCTAITTGIVAATEPSWPTGAGSTVVDGGVTWTESGATDDTVGTAIETVIQQVLSDNLGAAAPTLWCPVSPGWLVKWFLIGRQPLFTEIKALADEYGWCLRYMMDAGTPKLKLFDPLRTTTTSLRTFTPQQYNDPTKLFVDIKDIRNKIRVVFSDSQDRDASKNPIRKSVVHDDPASIAKYSDEGLPLFAEAAEDSTSNIDTLAEADNLALIMLSDLSEPTAIMQIPLKLFFFAIEMCDLYTFGADGVRFDSDQKLAVSQYAHSYSSTGAETSMLVRGKPASNSAAGWFKRMTDAEGAESHQLTVIENLAPIGISADTTPVGGTNITFDWGGGKKPKDGNFELHLSTSPGFTASSATLVATGKDQNFSIMNLDPAKTHYGVIVPVTRNGQQPVRGSASEEFSFIPGRAQATHLNSDVEWRRLPLNGGFETRLDPVGPPDFWEMSFGGIFGSWGVNGFVLTDANGISGSSYLKLKSSSAFIGGAIQSAFFNVNERLWYAPSFWKKAISGAGTAFANIQFFDEDHNLTGASANEQFSLSADVGVWVQYRFAAILPPAGTRFAKIMIGVPIGAGPFQECHFDDIRTDEDERWHVVGGAGEPAFTNSWAAFGAPYSPPRFMRTSDDWIVWAGMAHNGTAINTALATAPAGYRPDGDLEFAVTSNGGFGLVAITAAGVLTPVVGNTFSFSLSGIRYRAAP